MCGWRSARGRKARKQGEEEARPKLWNAASSHLFHTMFPHKILCCLKAVQIITQTGRFFAATKKSWWSCTDWGGKVPELTERTILRSSKELCWAFSKFIKWWVETNARTGLESCGAEISSAAASRLPGWSRYLKTPSVKIRPTHRAGKTNSNGSVETFIFLLDHQIWLDLAN